MGLHRSSGFLLNGLCRFIISLDNYSLLFFLLAAITTEIGELLRKEKKEVKSHRHSDVHLLKAVL